MTGGRPLGLRLALALACALGLPGPGVAAAPGTATPEAGSAAAPAPVTPAAPAAAPPTAASPATQPRPAASPARRAASQAAARTTVPRASERQRQTSANASRTGPLYAGREDVLRFAAELAERRGWDRAWVERQLGQARQLAVVQRLIMPAPAGTAKNWAAYRARFIEPRRIQAGMAFWDAHASALERAQARYGVPAELVVGIIGVETFYGRIMGDFRALDALATLSFDFPTGRRDRTPFFRSELEELLAFARRENIEPGSLKGSFAGALGLPQFMPGSINRHAVDFDGDGHIDLIANPVDAIGSVAHYLAAFGWQRGMPTHYEVTPPADEAARAVLLGPDILPSFSAAQMQELGAQLPPAARLHEGPMALVLLENGGAAPSYVAGTQNFYAVTRYNWSSYYALAVIDLGAEIARARARR
ncbi:MAG: lytic murein transglycosylase B [Rubrivivax sp.]|nr:lytic murein transglycosylase B [Rubrivivax sp.]